MSLKKIMIALLAVIIGIPLLFVAYINIKGIPSYPVEEITFAVEKTAVTEKRGEVLVSMLCAHCHKNYETGALTGRFVEDIPTIFGTVYSPNITQDKEQGIGSWTDNELVYLLRTGIKKDGSFAPPYMPKFPLMSDEDVEGIIAFLRSSHKSVQASAIPSQKSKPSFLTKMLTNMAMKPYPYPEKSIPHPKLENTVEYGEYLATAQLGCFECHSADFRTNFALDPPVSEGFFVGGNKMLDLEGNEVLSPNITMDETGIGTWTKEQFIQAIRFGRRPDGTGLQYPMLPYSALTDDEVSAIWEYLKTVPKIENKVVRKISS